MYQEDNKMSTKRNHIAPQSSDVRYYADLLKYTRINKRITRAIATMFISCMGIDIPMDASIVVFKLLFIHGWDRIIEKQKYVLPERTVATYSHGKLGQLSDGTFVLMCQTSIVVLWKDGVVNIFGASGLIGLNFSLLCGMCVLGDDRIVCCDYGHNCLHFVNPRENRVLRRINHRLMNPTAVCCVTNDDTKLIVCEEKSGILWKVCINNSYDVSVFVKNSLIVDPRDINSFSDGRIVVSCEKVVFVMSKEGQLLCKFENVYSYSVCCLSNSILAMYNGDWTSGSIHFMNLSNVTETSTTTDKDVHMHETFVINGAECMCALSDGSIAVLKQRA